MYPRVSERAECRGAASHRRQLLAGLFGPVCEVGAGNGLNFAHYPSTVGRVLAIEPEPTLRTHAAATAAAAPVPVRVVDAEATALPVTTGGCNAVVASPVLCSVADMPASLAEIHRVLPHGGELRFYEHVRSTSPLWGLVEDLVTPMWSRCAGGCHLNRDTATAIAAAGFAVTTLDRFGFRPQPCAPPIAHIIGRTNRLDAGSLATTSAGLGRQTARLPTVGVASTALPRQRAGRVDNRAAPGRAE